MKLNYDKKSSIQQKNEKSIVTEMLRAIEPDSYTREGIQDTPRRVVKMWDHIFGGYDKNPADVLTTFSADGADQIILLRDIELYSMCEHHMLPFVGKAHVAYLPKPDGKIVGISKLARLVEMFARRLQIQERIGDQVTEALMEHLDCKGAICIIEAKHMCMAMRGVEKQHSSMVTSSLKGEFRTDDHLKAEVLQLLKL